MRKVKDITLELLTYYVVTEYLVKNKKAPKEIFIETKKHNKMKARLLKKLLNTDRVCCNHKDYIAVGSAYVHNLISVDKKTLELKYALDTFHRGRNSLTNKDDNELLDIWDKLQELIDNGQIKDIIEGNDEIENPLPVFTYDDDKGVTETITDAYGYPNTTIDGELMYDNTFFKTREEAVQYEIRECESAIKMYEKFVKDTEEKLSNYQAEVESFKGRLNTLKTE